MPKPVPLPPERYRATAESETESGSFLHTPSAAIEKRTSRHIWLISYADFMTILMIFFLAMYGYTYLAKEAMAKQPMPEGDEDRAPAKAKKAKVASKADTATRGRKRAKAAAK